MARLAIVLHGSPPQRLTLLLTCSLSDRSGNGMLPGRLLPGLPPELRGFSFLPNFCRRSDRSRWRGGLCEQEASRGTPPRMTARREKAWVTTAARAAGPPARPSPVAPTPPRPPQVSPWRPTAWPTAPPFTICARITPLSIRSGQASLPTRTPPQARRRGSTSVLASHAGMRSSAGSSHGGNFRGSETATT